MGDKTGIEWTDATWNPVRGCSRVSEGCRDCYAETVAARPFVIHDGLNEFAGHINDGIGRDRRGFGVGILNPRLEAMADRDDGGVQALRSFAIEHAQDLELTVDALGHGAGVGEVDPGGTRLGTQVVFLHGLGPRI